MTKQRTRVLSASSAALTVAAMLAVAPAVHADDGAGSVPSTPTTDTPSQVQDINVTVPTPDAAHAATRYLGDHTGTFGIIPSDVKVIGTASSQGTESVRLQQTVHGVPVLGAQYLVHTKKHGAGTQILSTNGTYLTDLNVDTNAAATPEKATVAAEQYVSQQLSDGKMTAAKAPKVTSDSKGLVIVPDGKGTLTYDVKVSTTNPKDGTPVIKDVYVDADTSWPLFALDAIQTDDNEGKPVVGSGVNAAGAKVPMQLSKTDSGKFIFLDQTKAPSKTQIATFDGRGLDVTQVSGIWPASLTDIYGGPTRNFKGDATDAGLVDAHVNAGKVYDFYKSLGRDGLDGNGGDITSIAGVTYNGQPYVNAFWDGTKMVYGSGDGEYKVMSSELDVVGHEMTHGVVEHTAGLIYAEQPGSMNEALADYFGNAIDVNDSGISMHDPDSGLLGENLCRTLAPEKCAIRNLNDGRSTADYDGLTMEFDSGGVHENSTIFSGALWDIRKALGGQTADALIYKALSEYMTPLDDFVAGRDAVVQAAHDLHLQTGAIVSAFNKHGIKAGWEKHAGDATRLMKGIMTDNTGPAAGGGWWVQSQTDPTGSDPYSIYSGRTDGTGKQIKLSDPIADQNPSYPKRYNVLPATDGKNAVWWAWGAEDARLMIAPVDGSAAPKQIGYAQAPSYLSLDGDWVTWTSPANGTPKQYYMNINQPNNITAVDNTYYKTSGYGSVKDGKLVYLLSWPDATRYHLNLMVRDLATGSESMLPEILPKETDPDAGIFAPKLTSNKIAVGVDQYSGGQTGIMTMKYDGSQQKVVVGETASDAPYLGGYDASDTAITFESWPDDVSPHIYQVPLGGGTQHPMSCSSGVQFKVAADEGTRAVWLDGSYGDTSLVVRDKARAHC